MEKTEKEIVSQDEAECKARMPRTVYEKLVWIYDGDYLDLLAVPVYIDYEFDSQMTAQFKLDVHTVRMDVKELVYAGERDSLDGIIRHAVEFGKTLEDICQHRKDAGFSEEYREALKTVCWRLLRVAVNECWKKLENAGISADFNYWPYVKQPEE